MLTSVFTTIALGLKDLVAPARCLECLQENVWLCRDCRTRFSGFSQQCVVCEAAQSSGRICLECRDETKLYGVLSAGSYSNAAIRRGVHWLKFRGITPIAEELSALLLPYLPHIAPMKVLSEQAVLIPIPLHTRRQRVRGFNQSDVITQSLSRFANIPVSSPLVRTRSTHAQATLPHRLRQQNIQNAFAVQKEFIKSFSDKKYFILVDDVATSGATLNAAADVLSPTLPQDSQLWAVTVARG